MLITVNRQWCKSCGICIAFCPKKALIAGPDGKPDWKPEACSLCGLCERYCPDLAIELREEPEESVHEQ